MILSVLSLAIIMLQVSDFVIVLVAGRASGRQNLCVEDPRGHRGRFLPRVCTEAAGPGRQTQVHHL